ncbi:MAG: hypothetical protein GWN99_06605 [Gemmatimonadetes bacterium]|uniref:Nitrogen regulatory protein P-II n=1 Tax=Candidatus Kutchimonas denitrificans TaxID=3056748 RepID=A0AAE5CAT3_9BACT|nr:hypothetical protein [Gemmatimonadota bacterium]NIR73683.1 hypothetical protein [Candidatus Kutchimonas denitrificans]NIS00733.1 hypothetical protein [Gemmatimonadota bacterium]NIT66320.1 hypothetical protein [Gemmatimonadota bacterium]NIU51538.1 hypothetical protein [Gemmatimonadota bacterium]
MKLAILMYLDDDQDCVDRLLKEVKVESFSRLSVEGHRPGPAGGWYGDSAPYQSGMLISVLPDDHASRLVDAVAGCTGVQDPQHPIRVAVVDVEQFVCCERNIRNEGEES